MSEEPVKTCQVKMHNWQPCGRPVWGNTDFCICHLDKEVKDTKAFDEALRQIFENKQAEYYDLTRFYFPKKFDRFPKVINKEVIFDNATFYPSMDLTSHEFNSEVSFENVVFNESVDFRKTKFNDILIFDNTKFNNIVSFLNVEFTTCHFKDTEFKAKVSYSQAKFHGNVSFVRSKYCDDLYFGDTKFEGKAEFNNVKFEGFVSISQSSFVDVLFDDSLFNDVQIYYTEFTGEVIFKYMKIKKFKIALSNFKKEAYFNYNTIEEYFSLMATVFYRKVDFNGCHINDNAKLYINAEDFDGNIKKLFNEIAYFRSLDLGNMCRVTFRKVSLTNCLFLETDLSNVNFVDVIWPTRERLILRILSEFKLIRNLLEKSKLFYRHAILDELIYDSWWLKRNKKSDDSAKNKPFQCNLVAQLYRQLQANYIENYRYSEAGDFYIGEQDCIRKSKGKLKQYFSINFLYKIISCYGQSYYRPFFWLIIFLLLSPLYLLYDGINLYPNESGLHISELNYDWSSSFKDFLFLKEDYWNALGANLSLATFNKGAINDCLIEPYKHGIITLESAVIISLITFFILALRRAFKRKSF